MGSREEAKCSFSALIAADTLIALAALAGLAFSLAVLFPGQYGFDSAYQLWQARTGMFSNITPVPMMAVWSALLNIFNSPASLLCLNLTMFWAGIGLCFRAMRVPVWLKVSGILVVGLNPLSLVEMAHLLSDAHMTAVMLLGVGLMAQTLRGGSRSALTAACLLLVYAGTIRQNALVAIIPFGPLALLALRPENHMGKRLAMAAMLVAGVSCGILATTLDRVLVTERHIVWPMLALWDLAAISVRTDELQLPPFTHGDGMSVDELRETGAFNPVSATYLFSSSRSGVNDGFTKPYTADQRSRIGKAWWAAVADHPVAYLAHRAQTATLLFGKQSGAPHGMPYIQARMRYLDNPPLPEPWLAQAQQRLYRLANRLTRTWLFSALPYVVINAIALMLAWRKRREMQAAIAVATSCSALIYAASFLLLAPSAELRYLTWPIVAAVPALAFALSSRFVSNSGPDDPAQE